MSERSGGHCVEFGWKVGLDRRTCIRSINFTIMYPFMIWIKRISEWGPFAVFSKAHAAFQYAEQGLVVCPCLYIKSNENILYMATYSSMYQSMSICGDGIKSRPIYNCPEYTVLADEFYLLPEINIYDINLGHWNAFSL